MKRLAIITTHPIQYNAPLFAMLHNRGNITLKVFYTWGEQVLKKKFDPGFDKNIEWDIPLLDGYDYCFVKNVSANTGSHHYKGIDNPTLISDITKWNPDAVLIYGWNFKSHLKVLKFFHNRIPILFRGDSTLLSAVSLFKKLLRKTFLKWVYNKVDKALYAGTHNKNYFLEYGMKEQQLIFTPHAIDNGRFISNEDDFTLAIKKWKDDLNIKDEDIGFLYAGKLDNNKNVSLLLKAFTELHQQNIFLIIAGNGIMENELKSSVSAVKNIHFMPFQNQSNMPVLYRLSDVFVLPSKSETWGLGINEAMACSRAVLISSGCGAAIDLVHEGQNGFIFLSENWMDLKQKMLHMITNKKNELQKMGNASLQIIKEWSYEKDCRAIEKLLN